MYGPSQWETMLQCKVVSHWLGAFTKWSLYNMVNSPGIILCMHPANERWRYIVRSSLIGWAHILYRYSKSLVVDLNHGQAMFYIVDVVVGLFLFQLFIYNLINVIPLSQQNLYKHHIAYNTEITDIKYRPHLNSRNKPQISPSPVKYESMSCLWWVFGRKLSITGKHCHNRTSLWHPNHPCVFYTFDEYFPAVFSPHTWAADIPQLWKLHHNIALTS